MKKSAVEWFSGALAERGVSWISTLCGHGLDPLFQAARQAGIRLVDTRNEQTAAYVAECYGRLAKRPGVCAVSSGVAVANALTGVMNAWFDSSPMLLISGSADHEKLGLGAFQDSDQTGLARPVTRFSRTIDVPSRAVQILDEALAYARTGPVHLMFPMDMQRAQVDAADLVPSPAAATGSAPTGAPLSYVEQISRALLDAQRPLIIAPSDAYYSGEAADLISFAEAFSIPVQTPIWDRGIFDAESPACLGVIGAATGGPALLAQTDCLILAGEVSDYRVGFLQSAAKRVFRLRRGWRALREAMVDIGGLAFTAWLEEARRLQSAHRLHGQDLAAAQKVGDRPHAVHIIEALEKWLPPDAVLVIDGGSIGQWAHQLMAVRRYPGHWLTCGRSGVVGYGIGGAMAARLAFPDRPVVLLSGDGSFTFSPADLECAHRQGLHFAAIVADDQCWGITHSGHLRQFGAGISTQLGPVQFDLLARSFGCAGHRVDKPGDIGPRLREALEAREVTVLHVPITGGNPA